MPDHVRDYIRRRRDSLTRNDVTPRTRPHSFDRKLLTPRAGQMDAIMYVALLYILLDGLTEAPALWHGWLVAGETEYAVAGFRIAGRRRA